MILKQKPMARGKLYFRYKDGKFDDLFYPLAEVTPGTRSFGAESIAELGLGDITKPCFGSGTEIAMHKQSVGDGTVITFKKATKAEVLKFLASWSNKQDARKLKDWVSDVRKYSEGLLDSEKKRLAKIIAGM